MTFRPIRGERIFVVEPGTEVAGPETGPRLVVTDEETVFAPEGVYMTQKVYDALKADPRVKIARGG